MIADPVWWQTFDYKLSLAVVVISGLVSVVVGIWRLSKRYTDILHGLDEKVSHNELKEFKTEILEHVEKSSERIKADMNADRKENRSDHKDLLRALSDLNRLLVTHIDRIAK